MDATSTLRPAWCVLLAPVPYRALAREWKTWREDSAWIHLRIHRAENLRLANVRAAVLACWRAEED